MADAITPDTLAAAQAATLAADLAAVEATIASGDLATLDVQTVDNTDSPYTLTSTNGVVLVDAAAGPVDLVLPAASSVAGRVYHLKRIDSTGNTVTVDPASTETIDGDLTVTIDAQWENLMLASTSTEWIVL